MVADGSAQSRSRHLPVKRSVDLNGVSLPSQAGSVPTSRAPACPASQIDIRKPKTPVSTRPWRWRHKELTTALAFLMASLLTNLLLYIRLSGLELPNPQPAHQLEALPQDQQHCSSLASTPPLNMSSPQPNPGQRQVARGIFPAGCKWRDVQYPGTDRPFWHIEEYEWWDTDKQLWTSEQPAACLVPGLKNPDRWPGEEESPRTEANCTDTHCVYNNLWYNNGRFYLLVDGPEAVEEWGMTRNQPLHVLHVDDAQSFIDSVDYRVVTGDTLIFDFIYFLHPTAIGHWPEMMFPLFSILRREPDFRRTPHQFVLLHLKRVHLMEWVRAVIAVTLGIGVQQDLPPVLMQQEGPTIWTQVAQPLEGYGPNEWVSFERALVVRDIFTGGVRTFLNRADAQDFRASLYSQYGLPPPRPMQVPRVITFQRKRANRRVANEEGLLKLLRKYGEVRVVEFNSSTSFKEQLETIATTGVLISVHTSNLANAPFLPPGAGVVEIIQRNWVWHDLDRSFQVQTAMMGDIHHFAWRARHRNQTIYINKRDAERFGEWTYEQCATEDCVEAHTEIDVVVNLAELEELLDRQLPWIFAGAPIEEAALPWPDP